MFLAESHLQVLKESYNQHYDRRYNSSYDTRHDSNRYEPSRQERRLEPEYGSCLRGPSRSSSSATNNTSGSSGSTSSRYGDPAIHNGGGPARDGFVRSKDNDERYYKGSQLSRDTYQGVIDAVKDRDERYYRNSGN